MKEKAHKSHPEKKRLDSRGQSSLTSHNRLHMGLISDNTKVTAKQSKNRPRAQRITLTLGGKSHPTQKEHLQLPIKERFARNCELVTRYLKWLEERGLKLPENPRRRGEVFSTQVEIEAGLKTNSLNLKNRGDEKGYRLDLNRIVWEAAPRIGMEVRVLPQRPGQKTASITYEQLWERGSEERKRELKAKPNARQQMYNTRSALNRFVKFLSLEKTSPIGSELAADFRLSVREVMGNITQQSTRKKFQTEIHWWHDFYHKLVKEQAIPAEFSRAVAYLMDRSGLSLSVLTRLIGVSNVTLQKWSSGIDIPSVYSNSAISQMELLFKLPAGTLLDKLPHNGLRARFRISQLPDYLQNNRPLARRVIPHLPYDFCDLPVNKQKEIVVSIDRDIVRGDDLYTQKCAELLKLPYRLKQWPKRLEEEFNDFAAFKTSDRPPLGMKRGLRWRPTTTELTRTDMALFFGALVLPVDSKDERLCGLGVPDANLSLALIACPLAIDWYIRFRAGRTQYTQHLLYLIASYRAMLNPDTGWLPQQPHLAHRLKPIRLGKTNVVSRELIAKAQIDWAAVCEDARRYYKELIKELKPEVTLARDPFHRIEGILRMDNPFAAFKILIDGMRNALPNPHAKPVLYHTAIRDCALSLLIGLTGFRAATVSQLDYTGDATGHLFLRDGAYVLNVPRRFFKEENSPFFGPRHRQNDYEAELPNIYGAYELFNEYLNISRPWLLNYFRRECKENPLFIVSIRSKVVRASARLILAIYRRATTRHLVENKWRHTGIPLVKPCGPHSARHIRGTAIIKKTGSFKLAGDANHQSEEMARMHYARFLPADRIKKVNDVLC